MNAVERPPKTAPTPPQTAATLRGLLIGAAIGYVLVELAARVLDRDTLENPLWKGGRHVAVVLLAWVGWLLAAGKARVVSENVECLAIAVVMALILKHFLIEAYKIPTGSMQPTILGNAEAGIFDRVLVNKFAYLIDEPERYEVIVFKYPLNRSQNYIKRLIGLPDEEVTLRNGNVFVATADRNGHYGPPRIARKPAKVRESVLKTVYPAGDGTDSFAAKFTVERGKVQADGDSIRCSGDAAFRFLKNDEPILDRYLDGYDPSWGIEAESASLAFGKERVGDLAIAFEIEVDSAVRDVAIEIAACGMRHRATLRVGDHGTSILECGVPAAGSDAESLVPLPGQASIVVADGASSLKAGDACRIEFFHVDQELALSVDGATVLDFRYDTDGPLPQTDNAVRIEVRGGEARISDLGIRRDIYYTTTNSQVSQTFRVPSDSLFAMGDNTQNSHDGRQWNAQKLRFQDGTEILREGSARFDGVAYVDVYGETFSPAAHGPPRVVEIDSDSWHYIPRRLLLGKAVAVFWPILPHFRWKLIR